MQAVPRILAGGAAAGLLVCGVLTGPAVAGVNSPATVTVVVDHLNNPRGLALASDGSLLLAEAGKGGSTCLDAHTCVGNTGSFDKITNLSGTPQRTRLIRGLFSVADQSGMFAEGPVGITTGHGTFGIFGGNTAQVPPGVHTAAVDAARTQAGQLAQIMGTSLKTLAPVGDQDYQWTKDHKSLVPSQFPDSNPNGVLVVPQHVYVVDAGANTLLDVYGGVAHVVAFFPAPAGAQTDTVPTCVAQGPDGALYVGELLGGFYAPGHARIWRVVPGQAPTVWASGLTTVQGCGFTPDGAFYATEFMVHGLSESPDADPSGDVVQIVNGRQTHLGTGHLFFPSGFAPAAGHGVYVSNCSVATQDGMGKLCPTGGQVLRIG